MGDGSLPVRSRGKARVEGPGYEVPQELKHFYKIALKFSC